MSTRSRLFLAIGLLLPATPLSAQVQDTVTLRSGNLVVGEIKSLRRGNLSFDTEEMDIVKIDWDDIAFLTSSDIFEVTLVSGAELFGSLQSADTAVLVIVGTASADTVPFEDVIEIGPIEAGFFARTNGFVDLGTNLAKANDMASVLAKGRFSYQSPKWGFDVKGESYWQRQESVSEDSDTTTERTSRNSASLTAKRFLGGKWALTGGGVIEQNQELDLDLRVLGLLGGVYAIIRNQSLELSAAAGAAANSEEYAGEGRSTSGEILAEVRFDVFDIGDLDFYTDVSTFVNPSGGGRFRSNLDARIAWEIIDDFIIGLNITESYDSRPPSEGATKRDFQYAFSIGWSWS